MNARKPYPSDVSDEEWEFAAPYVSLVFSNPQGNRTASTTVHNSMRSMQGSLADTLSGWESYAAIEISQLNN